MDNADHSLVAEHFSFTNAAIILTISFAISIIVSFVRAPKYPETIPWVGYGKGWLAAISNTLGGLSNSEKWIQDGYDSYSKNDKSFVLPGGLGSTAEIVIPTSQMQWMLDQPDHILSTNAAHYDLLNGEYVFIKPIILQDPYHEHVVHKNLARNLNTLIPDLNDEICHDVDEMFGMSEEWKEINVFNMFLKIIPKITNRMLVGEPLCRNDEYLDSMAGFTNDVIRGLLIFGLTPKLLHPIIGPVAGLSSKFHFWKASKHSLPLIKQRLDDMRRKDSGDPKYKDWKEPNDFITWTVRTAQAEGRLEECEATRIAMRIMPLNFASIHTTTMTGHGTLLDVLSSDPSVLESLREEATRIYIEEGNQWTKNGLARMYRMDSAIRESQRYSVIAQTLVHRKVLAPEGVTSPDGLHYACGTTLSCPLKAVSFDGELVGGDTKYDAFRYSRPREEYEAKASEDKDTAENLKLRQTGLVTTSVKHYPFGHGRHACPGRFFVSHELKMMFAYLIMNYDIKHLTERPKTRWIGRNSVPAVEACIEVRRRLRA